jgi:hypothetical protein
MRLWYMTLEALGVGITVRPLSAHNVVLRLVARLVSLQGVSLHKGTGVSGNIKTIM